jgi:hypothetical protein
LGKKKLARFALIGWLETISSIIFSACQQKVQAWQRFRVFGNSQKFALVRALMMDSTVTPTTPQPFVAHPATWSRFKTLASSRSDIGIPAT